MGQDVAIRKGPDGIYDIPVVNNDLEAIDGLETAIIVSLFTYARTDRNIVADAFRRRGFSGNLLTLNTNYQLGSELWTLEQSRLIQDTFNAGENIVRRALNFLIEDGIVDNIEVSMNKSNDREATIEILLFKDSNIVDRYTTVWRNTKEV